MCRTTFDACYITIQARGMEIEACGTKFEAGAMNNVLAYHFLFRFFDTVVHPMWAAGGVGFTGALITLLLRPLCWVLVFGLTLCRLTTVD